jgi:putative ABC transport system permease protein
MRLAVTDLRGDLRRFIVLIACLALGTSVIAAVGSVGTSLKNAVDRDTTILMGGDVEASRPDRPANADELAYLNSIGKVAYVVDSAARGVHGDESTLIDLLAVDDAYPLLGDVISPQLPLGHRPAELLDMRDGVWGALVDPIVFDRLGIGVGGRFFIGKTEFEVRGTLTSLPDSAVRGFQLGLTALISTFAYETMSDLRAPLPGLLTHYDYKILLPSHDFAAAKTMLEEHFADNAWKIRSPREVAGELIRFYDMFTRFLLIVGLSSLLVGGVGVSSGVMSYIAERQHSIAVFRSLGATSARILVHFLTQIGLLTGVGVLIGVSAGAIASLVILPILGDIIAVSLPPSLEWVPLVTAASFGIIAGFAYSFLPLMQAQRVSPALLFRSLGSVPPRVEFETFSRLAILLPVLLSALALFLLAVVITGDVMLVTYYALGVVSTFVVLRLSASGLLWVFRQVPAPRFAVLRHALRNIPAPGSSAPIVVVSLGLGLALLLVIALLDVNLHNQLTGQIVKDAPTFVVTDLFSDEVEDIEAMKETDPNLATFDSSPMLRGAITKIKDRDPRSFEQVGEEASFMLARDIPLTYRAEQPANSTITAGEWWASDYQGPPLVSLRDSLRSQLGLRVGDTIEFSIFGDTVTATIANFRDFDFQKGTNFMVTFSPNVLDKYPATFLGTIKAADGREKDLERTLTREFPDVSFLPIGDALRQAATLFDKLATAVNTVGGLAVINGLLVLAGTMASGRKQREADATIEKVLGATRGDVLRVFVLEYAVLGAFSAVVAAFIGIAAAWVITITALEMDFYADPVLLIQVLAGAIVLTVATGAATTWQALSSSPASHLRATG